MNTVGSIADLGGSGSERSGEPLPPKSTGFHVVVIPDEAVHPKAASNPCW